MGTNPLSHTLQLWSPLQSTLGNVWIRTQEEPCRLNHHEQQLLFCNYLNRYSSSVHVSFMRWGYTHTLKLWCLTSILETDFNYSSPGGDDPCTFLIPNECLNCQHLSLSLSLRIGARIRMWINENRCVCNANWLRSKHKQRCQSYMFHWICSHVRVMWGQQSTQQRHQCVRQFRSRNQTMSKVDCQYHDNERNMMSAPIVEVIINSLAMNCFPPLFLHKDHMYFLKPQTVLTFFLFLTSLG